jgi:hypothetical protein
MTEENEKIPVVITDYRQLEINEFAENDVLGECIIVVAETATIDLSDVKEKLLETEDKRVIVVTREQLEFLRTRDLILVGPNVSLGLAAARILSRNIDPTMVIDAERARTFDVPDFRVTAPKEERYGSISGYQSTRRHIKKNKKRRK